MASKEKRYRYSNFKTLIILCIIIGVGTQEIFKRKVRCSFVLFNANQGIVVFFLKLEKLKNWKSIV
jgi:hypothetical protein